MIFPDNHWIARHHKPLRGCLMFYGAHWLWPGLAAGAEGCGEMIQPLAYYENISLFAVAAGFALVLAGILVDRKNLKALSFGLALFPVAAWVYVQFFIDFNQLKRNVFAYNALAEGTLANIAEAQDRYKSEQGVFLKDLQKLYSHTAGSQGIDPCVRIIKIDARWNHWAAEAKHVSSPDTVLWDSQSGSSLKKG